MPRAASRRDLQPFIDLTVKEKAEKAAGQKLPNAEAWERRYALIRDHFPIVDRIDWRKAFTDEDLWGRLIRDILRVDQANDQNGGQGPRPALDPTRAKERLRQFKGDDYSYLPFIESFGVLAGDRSIRHLVRKTGIGRHQVWNLKNGVSEPDLYTLEVIAKAFGKHPSYFLEYRVAYVLGALADQMLLAPEMTVDMYRRLQPKAK